MRLHSLTVAALAAFVGASASAQRFDLGRILSTEFLTRLVRPAPSTSKVAIIHAEVGSAMVLDRKARGGPVEFIDGAQIQLWAQIAQQLPAMTDRDQRLRLMVERTSVASESCPRLVESVEAFIERLEDVVADIDGVDTKQSMFVTDAMTFRIVVAAKDAEIAVRPDGPGDSPLQQAAGRLHSVVSGCAASSQGKVEQHDF